MSELTTGSAATAGVPRQGAPWKLSVPSTEGSEGESGPVAACETASLRSLVAQLRSELARAKQERSQQPEYSL